MWCLKKTMIQPELYNYTLATDNTNRTTVQSQWETVYFNSSCVKRERGGEQMYMYNYVDAFIHVRG